MSVEPAATNAQMDNSMTLLITEYQRSSEFCNHVDNVRNVITSFFLTLAGAAAFAVDRYLSNEALHKRGCIRGLKPPVSSSDRAM